MLYLHIAALLFYSVMLGLRMMYLFLGQEESMLLFTERSRSWSTIMLAIIVITGIYLGLTYDFSHGLWFVVKLFLLAATAFVGDYAVRTFSRPAGVATLFLYLYIMAISITKSVTVLELDF